MPLEIGKEMGTSTSMIYEVSKDRGLDAEARAHEAFKVMGRGGV